MKGNSTQVDHRSISQFPKLIYKSIIDAFVPTYFDAVHKFYDSNVGVYFLFVQLAARVQRVTTDTKKSKT